jgi:hypothetical protein
MPRKPPTPLRSSHKGARKGRPGAAVERLLPGMLPVAPVPKDSQPFDDARAWVYPMPSSTNVNPMGRFPLTTSFAANEPKVVPPLTCA